MFNCLSIDISHYRCELVFENCFVPEENILGQEGKGIYFSKAFEIYLHTYVRLQCASPMHNLEYGKSFGEFIL